MSSHAGSHIASQTTDALFWYSRHTAYLLLACLFLLVQAISSLIPPFQSPDEVNHLKRAYLLSKGEIFLGSSNGHTGGAIDSGLLDYMGRFGAVHARYEQKIVQPDLSHARRVTWSADRQFSALPNIAAYFPLPYTPQALAFAAGELTGLSISDSYYLARFFSLAATVALLWAAFLLYPVPLIVVALLVTPMSLFQLGSASLDAVSFGTTLLVGALFMRGCDTRFSFTPGMHIALLVGVFSLATSRFNMVLLTLLPSALFTIRHSRAYLISSAVAFSSALAWLGFALVSVQGMPVRELSTTAILKYYAADVTAMFRVLFATLSNGDILKYYWGMFIGVLGSLDTPLDTSVYVTFGVLLAALAVISIQRDKMQLLSMASLSLAGAAGASLLLLFVILLVTWTPHPADIVWGIQGRYFTPILMLLAFTLFSRRLSLVKLRVGLAITLVIATLAVGGIAPKLLNRYWISDFEHAALSAAPREPNR